ncbi:MAG: Fe-S-containing protein, partial [Halobacteriota archaeon]|nr:Fe-S-containing protein [Halobacteriota archaeon]
MTNAEERKLELEERRKKTRNALIASIVVIVAAILGVYLVMSSNGPGSTFYSEPAQTPSLQSGVDIRIPLSEISSDAKFYSYETVDGVTVRYFAVIGTDGEVHVATDACDQCYGARKGY